MQQLWDALRPAVPRLSRVWWLYHRTNRVAPFLRVLTPSSTRQGVPGIRSVGLMLHGRIESVGGDSPVHAVTAYRPCVSIGGAGGGQWDEVRPETILLMVAALRVTASRSARVGVGRGMVRVVDPGNTGPSTGSETTL